MALTLAQLLKSTPASRKESAEGVRIKATKVKKTPKGYPMVMAKTESMVDAKGQARYVSKRNTYLSSVEIYPKGYVIVSCGCDDFCFTWEYANNKKGASRIEYCNGEPPGTRNPGNVPGLCKHLVRLARHLKEKGVV